ncbi:MAG: FHA domain-containing protein, partial [Candidatus Nanopelagicales bacterium]
LYLANRPSDALEACRRLRRALDDELAVDPSPAIQDLELRILRQEPLESKAPSTSQDLGKTVVKHRNTRRAQLRDRSGQVTPIGDGTLRIGRAPDNNVVLRDDQVSRYHAAIVQSPAGILIRDLWSSNGVYVRGNQVFESAMLNNGDEIEIGSTTFVFELLEA